MLKFLHFSLLVLLCCSAQGQTFSSKLDVSTRFDTRHEKDPRYQYRIRWYPQISFSEQWSWHAFAVTGDDFSSSYNTFGANQNHQFKLRRLYARHSSSLGKTEIGVIPTYKGRVSSTGLSKDGWITGIRNVTNTSGGKFEVVIGELDNFDEPNAFKSVGDIDYFEMEFSSAINENYSFEVAFERMVDANFISGEIRYQLNQHHILALELVDRLDNNTNKLVASVEGPATFLGASAEYFFYYSYVSEEFGTRAELTEDFIDVGHAASLEIQGELVPEWGLDWFTKLEANEGTSRWQLGLKLKI